MPGGIGSAGTALIIEHETHSSTLGATVLEQDGFKVLTARDARTGVLLARARTPELILIDIGLPDTDAFAVCASIREFSDAYIFMLTTRDDEAEKVAGFRSGADGYVAKPYRPAVLSARIGAIRRRLGSPAAGLRKFGDLSIDLESRVVQVGAREVQLTRTEFDLLRALTDQPRKALSRSHLMQAVWGSTIGDHHLIEVHTANLRRKLGQPHTSQGWIRTVRGIGYRFDPGPAPTRAGTPARQTSAPQRPE